MKTRLDDARTDEERDAGFTLIEQLVSMMLVFTVLLGLLLTLGAGTRGIANGRQRTVATSLAKQRIEKLQGSAYADIAMNLGSSGLSTDPYVTVTPDGLRFEGPGGEKLVGGSTTPYKTVTTQAGATYTERAFVTAVETESGAPHRRITVIVEWTPSMSGNNYSMRFSSLAYPLDYTSYPAGSGTAEVAGAAVTVTGNLDAEVINDVHFGWPSAQADTNASTLRIAHGSASSSTGVVSVENGIVQSTSCSGSADSVTCPLSTFDDIADNDAGSPASDFSRTPLASFAAATASTSGGLTVTTPAGTTSSEATTDECASCGFADGDGVPWSKAVFTTTTESVADWSPPTGGLSGSLWHVQPGWTATATVDHEVTSGGVVDASAEMHAPEVQLLSLDGVPDFTAAVIVGGFNASVRSYSGNTPSDPSVSATTTELQIWNGSGYDTISLVPGALSADILREPPPLVVTDTTTVEMDVLIESQPSASSPPGMPLPKTEAVAQQPSLLTVTVNVTVISGGVPTSTFTVRFDYGQVTASSTWVDE